MKRIIEEAARIYADEMKYKIIAVRDLVLSETYEEKDKK